MVNQNRLSNRMIGGTSTVREDMILGQQAIADELGVCMTTYLKLKDDDGLPTAKLGGQVFTTRTQINNWINNKFS